MAATGTTDSTADWTANNLTVTVVFRFEEQWHIGRVGSDNAGVAVQVDDSRFPPGGGATPPKNVVIAPVHLQGLSADAVADIIHKRAADMAILAEAMTIANIQFREALESIAPAPPTTD